MPELHLPDVSEFQPNVDWAKVVTRGKAPRPASTAALSI